MRSERTKMLVSFCCLCLFILLAIGSTENRNRTSASSVKNVQKEPEKPSMPTTTPLPVVYNSAWDASVRQVKSYLSKNLKDPDSVQYIEWSKVIELTDGGFAVRCKYRAKNSFGGYVVEEYVYYLDRDGNVVSFDNGSALQGKVVDTSSDDGPKVKTETWKDDQGNLHVRTVK